MCWHHVDPRDVAEAFRLSLSLDWQGFEAFYLSAPSTLHPVPTLARIEQVFGRLPDGIDRSRYDVNPFAPMFDTTAAKIRLGWTAHHDLRAEVTGVTKERTHA